VGHGHGEKVIEEVLAGEVVTREGEIGEGMERREGKWRYVVWGRSHE
jgi:hypothetical protein